RHRPIVALKGRTCTTMLNALGRLRALSAAPMEQHRVAQRNPLSQREPPRPNPALSWLRGDHRDAARKDHAELDQTRRRAQQKHLSEQRTETPLVALYEPSDRPPAPIVTLAVA